MLRPRPGWSKVDNIKAVLLVLLMISSIVRTRAFARFAITLSARCKTDYKYRQPSVAASSLSFVKNNDFSTYRYLCSSLADPPEEHLHLYQEWTLEQDQILWSNYLSKKSNAELASLLGRGLGGIQSRLLKLKDVNSSAYVRLFADGKQASSLQPGDKADGDHGNEGRQKERLVPVSEVIRRIKYDDYLSPADFIVQHYDRVDEVVVESPMDAPNHSISSNADVTALVDALPEHRIVGIKYKERVVWDRNERLDLVFGNKSLGKGGIVDVIAGYNEWKQQRDEEIRQNRQQQVYMVARLNSILGADGTASLQDHSSQLLQAAALERAPGAPKPKKKKNGVSLGVEVERFVEAGLDLFRRARNNSDELSPATEEDYFQAPSNDFEALDCLSELVALLPNAQLRPMILEEIVRVMQQYQPQQRGKASVSTGNRELPPLDDNDFDETFVRGGGAGGQKINKTSSKVVLLHHATQLRVECQDTRSLQQNRKIARKRLRQKLDEYYNGSQSRSSVKNRKVSQKKARQKARNRARLRKKKQEDEE